LSGNQDRKIPKGVLLLNRWKRSNLGPTLKDHGADRARSVPGAALFPALG